MNRTLLQISALYDNMGKAEKKIADFIKENPDELISLSITALAARCKCSEATVVRFSRKIGFIGYQDLKISLAKEQGKKKISFTITKDDDCYGVFEKVTNDIYLSLEKTKKVLSPDMLGKAADKIIRANRVAIFGLGNSSSIAADAQHKFMRAGCNATAYSDNHMQAMAASHLGERDVAIGISHSGSSKDIVDAMRIARSNGATTICITNNGKSPITRQSDISLFTASDETKYSILGLNSRISQLAVIDSIYFYMVYQMDQKALEAIEATERALLSKKY